MQFTLDMWEGKILAQEARVGKASPKYVQYCIAQDNDLQLFFSVFVLEVHLWHMSFFCPPPPSHQDQSQWKTGHCKHAYGTSP